MAQVMTTNNAATEKRCNKLHKWDVISKTDDITKMVMYGGLLGWVQITQADDVRAVILND